VNISDTMKLVGGWKKFQNTHPRFAAFLEAVKREGIREGAVIEVKVTTPEGKNMVSNLRLTADDMALLKSLSGLGKEE